MIIRALAVTRIFYLSYLNSLHNIIYPVRKRKTLMRMNFDSNKGIYTEFGRNILDRFRDDHDKLTLVDPYTNLPPRHLHDLPCMKLVLISLVFIISLIEIACTSILINNLDPLFCKNFEILSDIHVILEATIREKLPPLREITYQLQIIWSYRDGVLDI